MPGRYSHLVRIEPLMERALRDEVWRKQPSDIAPEPELLPVPLSASPRIVPRHAVGTWIIDSMNQLSVLCELEFDPTHLRMLTGHGHNPEKLAVYSRWLQEGHEPPPVWAEIGNDHTVIVVTDGEHRMAALQRAGRCAAACAAPSDPAPGWRRSPAAAALVPAATGSAARTAAAGR